MIGQHDKHPRQTLLRPTDVDHLARQHTQLMAEVWILRDRIKLLESVLERSGLLTPGQLDTMVPDGELKLALQQDRDAFVERVVGVDPADRTVEHLRSHGRPRD